MGIVAGLFLSCCAAPVNSYPLLLSHCSLLWSLFGMASWGSPRARDSVSPGLSGAARNPAFSPLYPPQGRNSPSRCVSVLLVCIHAALFLPPKARSCSPALPLSESEEEVEEAADEEDPLEEEESLQNRFCDSDVHSFCGGTCVCMCLTKPIHLVLQKGTLRTLATAPSPDRPRPLVAQVSTLCGIFFLKREHVSRK